MQNVKTTEYLTQLQFLEKNQKPLIGIHLQTVHVVFLQNYWQDEACH